MPTFSPADITRLCDNWRAAAASSAGVGGSNTEQFRLLANGVTFHELPYESLAAALIGTSKILLWPRLNSFPSYDHFMIWSWLGEMLSHRKSKVFPAGQNEIKSLLGTALRASLAHCRKPPSSRQEFEEQNRISRLRPAHAQYLLNETGIILTYLAFPLLEALLKRACSNYVASDGAVLAKFPGYAPKGKGKGKKQCRSLRDLLSLHFNQVATAELKAWIDEFRQHLATIDGTKDAFDLIYSWRCQSLHGSARLQTIGATILSFSLLILLPELKNDFEQLRTSIWRECVWYTQQGSIPHWYFYPPY